MIVKKVKSNNDKPKYWQIGDLVDYIRFPHNRDPGEKVEHAGSRNFFTETHGGQKLEMISLATKSVHSKMPVSHWVFSWPACEQPSRESVEELVDIFLEEMGLVGHQTVYGLHYNTEYYHVHIAVNRMNEATGKVVLPHNGFDIEAAHRVVAIVEAKQKWQPEPNARYEVLPDGQVARKRRCQNVGQSLDNDVAKLKTEFDRNVGNRITERLNKEYGDPKLSGCIHPHRAPGFSNHKPKHRRPDGSYPKVTLLSAEKRECRKAFDLTWGINKEYAEAAKKRVAHKPQRVQGTFRPGDPIAAYYAHFENIRANLAVEDYSRVDAMIAVRLRATNHSQADVVAAIRQCAPTIRDGNATRNWQRYAERTANYAFGPAGDAVMARNEKYFEHWRNIEKMQERPQGQNEIVVQWFHF